MAQRDIARFYDLVTAGFLRPARLFVADYLARIRKNEGPEDFSVLDVGRGAGRSVSSVKCSAGKQRSSLPRSSAASPPFAEKSFQAVTLELILHVNGQNGLDLLDEAARISGRIILLDWSMAERNLDYLFRPPLHLAERAAGSGHYRAFRQYLESGALEGLVQRCNLRREQRGDKPLRVEFRTRLCWNTLLFMELR